LTLDEAVEVLNRARHNDAAGWVILPLTDGGQAVASYASEYRLTAFEAIAVAEAYRRKDPGI
jgi:hypothetical protein